MIRLWVWRLPGDCQPCRGRPRVDSGSLTLGGRIHATAAKGKSPVTNKSPPLPPGTPAPRSGIYEQVGPRGGRTGEQADSTRGKPLPPTHGPSQGWRLVEPAHHKGKK